MDATNLEEPHAATEKADMSKEIEEVSDHSSISEKSELDERLDEPISDEGPMHEDKHNESFEESKEDLKNELIIDTSEGDPIAETEPKIEEKVLEHDEPDRFEEKEMKVESDESKNDDDLSDRPLRHSARNDKPVASDEDKRDSSDEKKLEEKPSETPKERKRRYKNFSSSPIKTTNDEVIVKNKRKRSQCDKFCWRCHKENAEMHCSACPRSWHRKCTVGAPEVVDNWICGECAAILKAENVESRSVTMAHVTIDQLCMMLKHVVERMREYPGSEPFWKAVDTTEISNYLDYVVKPMDLTLLESNVRSKLYGSTDAFMADAKWIQHNCIVFNTCGGVYADTLKLTNAAKQLIKVARQEVSEMEACPDCYMHGRNLPRPMQSWFIEPCQRPHVLVWAKLKGFPYWPAKAMPRLNGQGFVDVRFFGAHDRAWVSPKDMYLYSRDPPTSFPRKRKQDLDDCVREIERHCQKLAMVFGEFTFAPSKIQYNPQDSDQIKLLLPHYDQSQPASKLMGAAMRKRSIANKKTAPQKRRSECDDDESKDSSSPELKKSKLENKSSSNEDDRSSGFESRATTPSEKSSSSPASKRRNGFFSEKSSPNNNQSKRLSAILPSRISKRRVTIGKSSPEKLKPRESLGNEASEVRKVASPNRTVSQMTLLKNPVNKIETTSQINKQINVNVPSQKQKSLLFFVVNNDKNSVKSVASTTPPKVTTAVPTVPTIKQEPDCNSPSPTPEDNKREGRARKTFGNKVPSFPQERVPSSPMVVIPNFQSENNRLNYEMPSEEAGPVSARLNNCAQELARRMAQLMEESLKDVAQNNLVLQDNSIDSYRASIHSLQLEIERLKWQHQEEITEMQHNHERQLKEMRTSLEAETQRMLEQAQKSAEEERKKSIEEAKGRQWCALCGKEANLYCCWNTSYCTYSCQQAHWSAHRDSCAQPAYQTITTNDAQVTMPKLVVKKIVSSA